MNNKSTLQLGVIGLGRLGANMVHDLSMMRQRIIVPALTWYLVKVFSLPNIATLNDTFAASIK
jgi:6-phosphogluconate dehydrogenase (decarboxylating)